MWSVTEHRSERRKTGSGRTEIDKNIKRVEFMCNKTL